MSTQYCSTDAGHVLDEQVTFGEQCHQRDPHGFGFAVDRRFDVAMEFG